MWRSVFLAGGIVLCILGGECLILDKAVMAKSEPEGAQTTAIFLQPAVELTDEIKPPEWAPWSLLSTGAVVLLYSYSIPRRNGG